MIETRQETPNRPSSHPKSTNTVNTSEQNKQSSFTQAHSGVKYSGNSAVEDNKANNKHLSSTKPTISHSERNNIHQEAPKSPSDRPLSYAPKKEGLTTEKIETPKQKRNRYTVPQVKKNNKNNVVKSMQKSDKSKYI